MTLGISILVGLFVVAGVLVQQYLTDGALTRLIGRNESGLIVAVIVMLLVTAVLDEQHNYAKDPVACGLDITRTTVMLGIFALGAAVVIIAGGIDLSAGSMIAFGGTICATMLRLLAPDALAVGELPLWVITVAILAAIFSGFLVGSLHAWLITSVGLPPFVATLASLVGLRSLARAIVETAAGGTQIDIPDERFRYLATSLWIPIVVFLTLVLLTWLILSRTVLGRHIYALGGNEEAARLSGIRTDRVKWFAYCFSAVLSAIAGVLYVCEISVAKPDTLGRAYELNAIAAAVVGGCSLQGGVGTAFGTVLGALFLRTVIDGIAKIIKSGADIYEGLIVGLLVVLAVAVNQLRQTGLRKQFFPGALGWVAGATLVMLVGTVATVMFGPRYGWGALGASALAFFAWKMLELKLAPRR